MKIIETTKELNSFCKKIEKENFITVDLEFIREKTYYAKLCLIQVGCIGDAVIIDPLAKDIDLAKFFDILNNKKIIKVFHSCRQDIEILYQLSGKIPFPLFDTQIAAMVCGFGESIGYEALVNKICEKELDKSSRLSNWEHRPLNEKQLQYALSDVTHLIDIYQYLNNFINEKNRVHWVDEEMEILNNPETYVTNHMEAWQKIRHRSHNRKFLTILQYLAAWREKKAQDKDVFRQAIIRDEHLLNIVSSSPNTLEELNDVRGIRKDVANGSLGTDILEEIKKAKSLKKENYVELEERKNTIYPQALFELSKMLLKIVSAEIGVVARLIASDDNLKDFSANIDENNPIFKGWRKEVFGDLAMRLREGKISISYDNIKKSIAIK